MGDGAAARDGHAPAIAVSTGFTDYGDYLGLALARPLVAAGAAPVVLPFLEDAAARATVLSRVDGVLLGFGRDIEPGRYGTDLHPAQTPLSPHRDAFELTLAREALERELPVLGVCRGMQVLNVALGGTLYRDRTEYPQPARGHPGGDWDTWALVVAATLEGTPMPEHPSHAISVAPGSLLHAALGDRATVNSYHHQAIRELGQGLVATAWADDGMIEAIELPGAPFVLAVQWELQEEWQDDPRSLDVFRAFVIAARRREHARGRPRPRAAPAAPRAGAGA